MRVPLTRRQMEILPLVAEGKTYREVADTLGVSLSTVHAHVQMMTARLPRPELRPRDRILWYVMDCARD